MNVFGIVQRLGLYYKTGSLLVRVTGTRTTAVPEGFNTINESKVLLVFLFRY